MTRDDYNSCMIPYMKGSGENKRLDFCVGAKVCSGKADTEEEARQICISEPPKPSKTSKTKKSCSSQMKELADCIVESLTPEMLGGPRKLETILTEILQECQCGGK